MATDTDDETSAEHQLEDDDSSTRLEAEVGRVSLQWASEVDWDAEQVERLARWVETLLEEVAPEADSFAARFVDDDEMARTSDAYRGRAESTDVLSFPGDPSPEGIHLGDVVISVPYAQRSADVAEQALERELQTLLLHGILHCLGYDHETDDGQMERLEDQLRGRYLSAAGPAVDSKEEVADQSEAAAPRAIKSGKVVLIGRPNAGKSTLMNRFLGEKLAIVSDKPQTTRQRLLGILTEPRGQMVFLDTPGVHKPSHRLNRRMVKAARDALQEADVVCLVVDAAVKWGKGDEFMLELIRPIERPKLVALNKIDAMRKSRLLPLIERLGKEPGITEIVPISALDGEASETLLDLLFSALPEGSAAYDGELLTTQTERFLVAERIREKILLATRDELPFATAVQVDAWQEDDEMDRLIIQATILVERPGQKKILIGHKGSKIKEIGTAARLDLQEFLGRRVFLDLFVREVANWREDPRRLAELELQNAFDIEG